MAILSFKDAGNSCLGDSKFLQFPVYVTVKSFNRRVIYRKPITGFYPKSSPGPFHNAGNEIAGQGIRISQVMPEYFELVSVIPVQPGHGTDPQKPVFVLIKTSYLVIR